MRELSADLSLGLDAFRPVYNRAVTRAAPMRCDLFGPLIGSVRGVRPTDRIVFISFRPSEIVDLALQKFALFDSRHAIQHAHLIEAALKRTLRRGAVVADDYV